MFFVFVFKSFSWQKKTFCISPRASNGARTVAPKRREAGVPSIPWSGDGLTAELTAEGTIPDETFKMLAGDMAWEGFHVLFVIGLWVGFRCGLM